MHAPPALLTRHAPPLPLHPLPLLLQRQLQENGEVHLSALGIAVSSMVTVAEILKNRGLAVEKSISTSLETLTDESK